ncbi:VWA domain-containing protein [Streptomyces sp. NPDC059255]|uniref:VWA domain-containing protein n=1 Tax=Streptomyces sp. NPDC059255 TaxID=3346793 RepID=UPI00367A23D2
MISLSKIEERAPGLVSLAKTAAVSLEKHGITDEVASVYLVLDHSASMQRYYRDGSVQQLAEQALALAVNLDDDGTVPLAYFASRYQTAADVQLSDYQGVIDRTHRHARWGSTNYAAAIIETANAYGRSCHGGAPGLVIFQSDGEPDHRGAAVDTLRQVSTMPIFWAFVGYGDRISFLEQLDYLDGRAVDNASFFHARDPHNVSDAELYDGITSQYGTWLAAARAAGIIRRP